MNLVLWLPGMLFLGVGMLGLVYLFIAACENI